ncbi:MAG: gliding motility protein GldM [Pseudoflavonifractor sp.]|nr:gliding motility protein GldM [Alloprevotella sp.]MCM1117205.1 gliding motility protein GldM [Pseudoflavonifractor sp.]
MAQSSGKLSPRQKMINLMYIVLTAMLALNVSSDVLNGFTQVEDGLSRTNATVAQRNEAILGRLRAFAEQNPDKGAPWLQKALEVTSHTDSMIASVDRLKMAIVSAADGKDADVANIRNRDDLESASVVMLNPATKRGEALRLEVDSYRAFISSFMTDSTKRHAVETALSTGRIYDANSGLHRQWEDAKFENQPVVAAVTLLTKLQNDIRFAEGEALNTLLNNVDAGDVRVNELNAFVIPQSRFVMRGEKYLANIVLAAVDTTARPVITIGGKELPASANGLYEFVASSTGSFDYSGSLDVTHGDGTVTSHPFTSSYVVMEPSATVSATMMNVLYAGIDNPISISVPGVPSANVTASMSNGSLTRSGDSWVAKPSKVGEDAVVTVSAAMTGGALQNVASTTFRVRRLPDPTAYIAIGSDRFKGGRMLPKAQLLQAKGLGAAIDDGMLDIDFRVVSFETVFYDSMDNVMPELSDGSNFSQRQISQFRRLSRGKRFFISKIKAVGPDGTERTLPAALEVIVG